MRIAIIALIATIAATGCDQSSSQRSSENGAQVADLHGAKAYILSELQRRIIHCPEGYYWAGSIVTGDPLNGDLSRFLGPNDDWSQYRLHIDWEMANSIWVETTSSSISDADRLNGIEDQTHFVLGCNARRAVGDQWHDCEYHLLEHGLAIDDAILRSGTWSLQEGLSTFSVLNSNFPSPCPGQETALSQDLFR